MPKGGGIVNIALTLFLADSSDNWTMHDIGSGWWIVMVPLMVIFMGGMMWMMMRMMGGSSSSDSSEPSEKFVSRDTPLETLERRFAEGEISIEDYRARREALVDGSAQPSGDHDEEERPAARRAGEGRQ
jgi:putative membrane protein